MKATLKAHAKELGFDACHVGPATPSGAGARLREWLRQGRHGEMGYMARTADRRADPARVLEGVRAIVILAASYHHPPRHRTAPPGTGQVARYARHLDYHEILAPRLGALTAFMDQLGGPGTLSKWYVDTGPVLERDLAERAGLGFIGKHTNLIRRDLGNWFFLAEIFTTLPLEPDTPERNRCGTCTRCLEACPTQAITAPFQLDARRCISYLTIELKGPIPENLRPAVGRRIFGCDDCLEVCPWNRFAREGRLLLERYRPELETPDLAGLLELDEPGFKHRFAGTPLLRARRRGLLRNVCVALGNTGGEDCVPALARRVRDSDPLIAEHADWAIRRIRSRHGEAGEAGLSSC